MATKAKRGGDDKRAGIIAALRDAGPNGVLGLVASVMEAVLLAWLTQATSGSERIAAGGLMVLVLLAVIVALVIIYKSDQRANVPAAFRTAKVLDNPSISPEEIKQRPNVVADAASSRDAAPGEIIAAPDGSYVIARPPEEWSIRQATVESYLKEKFSVKNIPGLEQFGSILVFQFGDGFTYVPRPDRTRCNGRRLPLLLPEPVQRTLQITSVPRRPPPFFIKRSLYDNFVLLETLAVQSQLTSIVSLTQLKLPKTNRDMLVAEQVQEFEDILVDDLEVANLRIDSRLTAISGDLCDYVFIKKNFRVGKGRDTTAERMDKDVEALFESFRLASVVDPEGAERAAVLSADQSFETYLSANGATIFEKQFGIAAVRLSEMEYNTPEGIALAMSILRPFRIFAGMLHDPAMDMPDLWAAMDAAERGDSAVLRNYLNAELKASAGSDQAAAAVPPAHPALTPPATAIAEEDHNPN